jgi:16S rRNA (cytosine967-C5)-methyltransferase
LVPGALLVRGAGALAETRAYLEGLFTIQDPGAQLAARLCDPKPGEKVLDACAGVGGKATLLAELAGGRAQIDAVDRSSGKLALLKEHAVRLGARSVTSHVCDLREPLPHGLGPYDRALLDAPCSGLGTLRRHPETKWRREASDQRRLARLQTELLETCAERIRPGGLLVYAVCTLTTVEGPEQITRFLDDHDDFAAEGAPRITLPHRDGADGFFVARLKRRGHS